MGTIRLMLALAVVCAHANLLNAMISGRLAVEAFYMISGFLITLVLSSKKYNSKISFYKNRALRIYPIYYVVAAASLIMWVAQGDRFAEFQTLSSTTKIFLATINSSIFGQDWAMFLRNTPSGLTFTSNFKEHPLPLHHFLLLPQAWTLGVELTFYLLAPFLIGKSKTITVIIILSLSLRIIANLHGLNFDPWTYRFFPFEIGIFLLGSASYSLYEKYSETKIALALPHTAITWTTIFVIAILPNLFQSDDFRAIALCTTLALTLPSAFLYQNRHRHDTLLGELSYPLYMVHIPVANALMYIANHKIPQIKPILPIAIILTSLALSVALERFVARPVERLRRKIRSSSAPIDSLA